MANEPHLRAHIKLVEPELDKDIKIAATFEIRLIIQLLKELAVKEADLDIVRFLLFLIE